MCVRCERARALLCACALALLALLVLVAADETVAGKRTESEFMSPMPFVLGSRYGRSQPRLISPRNDRFFMGSRYGKRSEPPGTLARPLLCAPLGGALYRCAPAPAPIPTLTNYQYSNRRPEESRELREEE
ncbi:unnamed protein product [Diatraea saccharalis]|uniref:RYamide n=1 Tax=Diatraea saccharalis TaxID=40085 RepID=A0A9N9WJH0_9NEOP|nr:unnamed protein product [Diatraea saccharalis]